MPGIWSNRSMWSPCGRPMLTHQKGAELFPQLSGLADFDHFWCVWWKLRLISSLWVMDCHGFCHTPRSHLQCLCLPKASQMIWGRRCRAMPGGFIHFGDQGQIWRCHARGVWGGLCRKFLRIPCGKLKEIWKITLLMGKSTINGHFQ